MTKYLSFLFVLLLLSACNEPKETDSSSNSAKTISSDAPAYGEQAWEISSEPNLKIGTKEGNESTNLYRVNSTIELADGKIVVSNSGTHELRFFDQNGVFLNSTGQNGQGPGDFGDFSSMRLYKRGGNTFVVNDNRNDRVQVFDSTGELLEVQNMIKIDGAGNPTVNNLFEDNSWLIWSAIGSAALRGEPGDIIQLEYGLHRLHPDFSYDKMIFKLKARPKYINEYMGVTNFPNIPLTADPIYVTDSTNAILFSEGSKPEIIRVDTSGEFTHTFTWNIPQIQTEDIWKRYKEEYYLANLNGDRKKQYEHFLSQDLPIPIKAPAISDIKIDSEGNIWVKRFKLPWQEHNCWDVLNAEGRWITTLNLPNHLSIMEIGSDYLLGSTYQNGFQQIVKHSLRKAS